MSLANALHCVPFTAAGLLVRTDLAGMGPGPDTFNGYEVSLQYGRGAMLGAHWLPGSFQELAHVPLPGLPLGASLELAVYVNATSSAVSFTVSVGGAPVLQYIDTVYAARINGTSVGLRSFYDDAEWEAFHVDLPAQ